jgi:hypothetical protein
MKPRPKFGIRLPGLNSHSLLPRLVLTCVTLVEKRPYSAANGFDKTSTDSTAPLGSSRSKSPVEDRSSWRCSPAVRRGRRAAFHSAAVRRDRARWTATGQQRLEVVAGQRLNVHL